jgi:hypothetical protein
LVDELDSDAAQIIRDSLDILLLSGFIGYFALLALARRRKN